jgi:PHD/YefM family antitoxin component YafN of YafNO toxin-antitoxin module
MKLSEAVKPVSYLQEYALEIIHQLAEGQQTLVITEDGEAKAVLLDIHVYEQMQERLALLKILAISSQHLRQGKTKLATQVFRELREKMKKNFFIHRKNHEL